MALLFSTTFNTAYPYSGALCNEIGEVRRDLVRHAQLKVTLKSSA
jgi:hypothetical protein